MLIDEIAIPQTIQNYYKESLAALSDQAFILGCRKLPALMEGLNQKSPSVKTLRARVSAKLDGKSIPGPILDLLREATLSERLFAALSNRAIKHGGDDWCSYFGITSCVGSLLLDDREEIRIYARDTWQRLSIKFSNTIDQRSDPSKLVEKFGPLLKALHDLVNGYGYTLPARIPVASPQKNNLSHEEQTRLIEGSTLVKRLQREVKEAITSLNAKTKDYNLLLTREQKAVEDLQNTQKHLVELQLKLHEKIAQGVSDALLHRLGTWIQPSEVLTETQKTHLTAIDKAAAVLKKQAQIDARYGTVTKLKAELSEAENLKIRLIDALNESLRPLPELQDAITSIDLNIQELNTSLKRGSIAPDSERLEELANRLSSTTTIEEALTIKVAITSDISKLIWPQTEGTKALELINRRLLSLYAQHGEHSQIWRDKLHKITPLETLKHCLLTADFCYLLIDGHNLLHKVRPFIASEYFDTINGPNAKARAYLIEKLSNLVDLHPNINCELWFDGPIDTYWQETEGLKVLFSGGQGSNRADARILESLYGLSYRGLKADYIVVTDDRDILKKSQETNAAGMSPIEFWMGFLSASN